MISETGNLFSEEILAFLCYVIVDEDEYVVDSGWFGALEKGEDGHTGGHDIIVVCGEDYWNIG